MTNLYTVKPALRDCSRDQENVVVKLTLVNYSEKCAFGGLKGQSLDTGGLKDRFDYQILAI